MRPNDEGLIYHALSRGNNRQPVLHDDADSRAFLDALARTHQRYPFRLHDYCLMTNHFHLLIRPEAGVAIGRVMQSLLVAHTGRYHRRHRGVGHVWQGRFRSPPVQDDTHLWTVLRYIEANPLRASMVADPADYPWSSCSAHVTGRPDPLMTELPGWSDLGATPEARGRAWHAKVRAALPEADLTAIRATLLSGRPFGEPEWARHQASALGLAPQTRPRGRPRKHVEGVEAKASPDGIGQEA